MAHPTDTFTATDLAEMIPEVWGNKINDFYRQKLKVAPFFVNRSDELADGGDSLNTPNISEMSANAKSNATAVTLNSPTETKKQLVVDQWYEVSFVIEDKEAAQVKKSYTLQQRYMKNAAYTAAKKLEVAIITLFSGFSTSVGTSGSALTDLAVRGAITSLEGANADYEEAIWFLHTKTVWTDLMSIDKFALAMNAPGMNPIYKAAMGMIYNRPIVATNLIQKVNGNADYCGALAVPDSIHWATSPLPGQRDAYGVRLQSNYIPEYLGTLTTADLLYGAVENRDAGGVKIISVV